MQVCGFYEQESESRITTAPRIFHIKTDDSSVESRCKDRFTRVKCEGICPPFRDKTPVIIKGFFSDKTYVDEETARPIFKVDSIEESYSNENADIAYLSGICSGIGVRTATAIVEKYGETFFEKISESTFAQELAEEIPRVTTEKALELIEAIRTSAAERASYRYLASINNESSPIEKLKILYGADGLNALKSNPYKVGKEIGYDFFECDKIAYIENFDACNEERLRCLAYETILKNENCGHTYIPLSKFLCNAAYIDKLSTLGEKSEFHPLLIVHQMMKTRHIIFDEINGEVVIYSKRLYDAEKIIARNLLKLQNAKKEMFYDKDFVSEIEAISGREFSKGQRNCFKALASTGVKVITGKPGSGKTTVINGLIAYILTRDERASISLCASTGNAAHRLSKASGRPASTVHKLLRLTVENADPEPIESDYIILDEMSMVGTLLFSKLLSAIKPTATLILVGDVHQLESVDAGDVLHDIMEFSFVEKYELNKIFRQGEDSSIIENADRIVEGRTDLKLDRQFRVIRLDNPEEIAETVKKLFEQRYKTDKLENVQVLGAVKEGLCGINELNKKLQESATRGVEQILQMRNHFFRLFDKVIFTKNNYEQNYLNGTQGQIAAIKGKTLCVTTEDREIETKRENLSDISLSYAMTIHKSQGSEYPACIIPLMKSPPVMLRRNLLYTGVTRAKKEVIIISEGNALETAIKNNARQIRRTSLKLRISEAMEKQY